MNYKKAYITIISFVFLLFINLTIISQTTLDWAKQIGSVNSQYGYSIVTDAMGNSYTIGLFTNTTIDFDPGPATFTLTSVGGADDIFITKLDILGNFVWAKKIGGPLNDYGNSIAIDLSGNIYITGSFSGTVDFDPNITVNNLTSSGGSDVFILKLDAAGNFIWAKKIGGTSYETGTSIVVDNSNNVLITGAYSGTVDFNPDAGVFNMTSVGLSDFFALKLNSSGNFVWAKSWGGVSNDDGSTSIKTDGSGNVYCSGYFSNTVDFDPGVGTYSLTSNGADDIFVIKLDMLGNFTWVKQVGGASSDLSYSASIDISNNLYLTGYFQGTVDFNPDLGTDNLTASVQDIYVLKLDQNGNFVWAKNMGGAVHSAGNSITNDLSGNIYVTGYFQGTVDFNPNIGVNNITSFGGADIFILKLDATGNYVWAIQKGGTSSEEAYSIAVDVNNNIYSTGYFQGTSDFDDGLGTFYLTSNGNYDIYIDKSKQCSTPLVPTNTTPLLNQTICSGLTTSLSASSTGTVNWYATPTGTTVLGSGTTYTTSVLSAGTYTYYAEASTCTVSATRTEITVTVNATPTISVNSGSICSGNLFTINPIGAITYTISGGSAIVSPTTNASYNVTGTSAQGCVSSNTAVSAVTVNQLPNVTAITNNALLCTGQTASLTASGASTYLWNTSATTSVIAVSPTITTNYTVTGTDANGCVNSSTITQNVSLCTGINSQIVISSEIVLYPNPSTSVFTISGIEVNSNISIYNAIGELVKSIQSTNNYETIDLVDYSNGIYFIKIKDDQAESIQKLIKQ